jgi:hypothetical protein
MSNDYFEIKFTACENILKYIKSELSDSKERERMLQKKLDNATETIRHLNNKIDKMKEK